MKSNTIKIVFSLFAILILTTSAFAATTTSSSSSTEDWGKNPFHAIAKMIYDLQSQINKLKTQIKNIQLTPGPQGPAGPRGPRGYPGVNGTDGENGEDGKSAYELAVENGFVGDVNTWLLGLVGPQGETGDAGEKGETGLTGATGPAGPKGDAGATGTDGEDGIHCWDLNSDHECDLTTEDKNSDSSCNVFDCIGAEGPAGEEGNCSCAVNSAEFNALKNQYDNLLARIIALEENVPHTCNDSIKNGVETDVDCGGTDCPKCSDDQHCVVDEDCFMYENPYGWSGVCTNGVCGRGIGDTCSWHGVEASCAEGYCSPVDWHGGAIDESVWPRDGSVCCESQITGACKTCYDGQEGNAPDGRFCTMNGASDIPDGTCLNGVCYPLCGNGVLDGSEECDDNNIVDGDGCSAACTEEHCTDSDGDGYYLEGTSCGTAVDCDDENASIHPLNMEFCNNVDDNCDGSVDEGVKTNFYVDGDRDGYGQAMNFTAACSAPTGSVSYVTNNTDCADNNAAINPGMTEVCDNDLDDDCDGSVDEDCSLTMVFLCTSNADCNDGNTCTDDICDAASGECSHPIHSGISCNDGDVCTSMDTCQSDGTCFGAPYSITSDFDSCTIESCNQITGVVITNQQNGVACSDLDCVMSGGCTVCQNGNCGSTPRPSCTIDANCDDSNACTVDSCTAGKCVHTVANCDDGNPSTIDSCSPATGCSNGACTVYYYDYDGDGYGTGTSFCMSSPTDLYRAVQSGDCNDGNALVSPTMSEICGNYIDDNCDGQIDDASTCYTLPVTPPANGTCATNPTLCDDGDPFTIDSCVTGGCVHYGMDFPSLGGIHLCWLGFCS